MSNNFDNANIDKTSTKQLCTCPTCCANREKGISVDRTIYSRNNNQTEKFLSDLIEVLGYYANLEK